ncbi:hypothetical protein A9Z42_0047490 [Trichoderma parareesei]|uniref:SET domain-containing protein n=1 Tax=Trichoderma parareesei TaxID=858221 RepID=A0A2H2ZLX5_TRIPA|nr:hypothetical protein A9Z42_0047490 [Trichoderma parareesei]
MSPLKPSWKQPSHPEIQQVIAGNADDFTTKSLSKVSVPPFGLFAKLGFPPCELVAEATYATVQMDKDKHLTLNSDLLYINHSCEPSLVGPSLCDEKVAVLGSLLSEWFFSISI